MAARGGAVRGPRGSYRKSAERRVAILDAALGVFAEAGYRAGSLREVAARVGMTEAGLLHHFPTKSALLAAVLEHRDAAARAIEPDPDDGAATLAHFLDVARRDATTPGTIELYCRVAAEATAADHPAHEYFVARYASLRERLGRAFTDLAVRGLLRAGVGPAGAAVATVALWDGLQVQWLLDRSSVDIPAELRSHLARLTALPF